MLFCVGFIANFIIGGVTGVFEAAIPVDLILHDTYHVVSHFYYVIIGCIAFALFAAIYYWLPLITGWQYQQRFEHAHFWLSMVGTNLTFFPMVLLGYGGMLRRYAGYDISYGPLAYFTDLHQVTTLRAFMLAVGQIIFVWNIVTPWLEGQLADVYPWNHEERCHRTKEWEWLEQQRETAVSDGGEHDDSDDASS